MTSVDELLAAAAERTGLDDLGGEHVLDLLAAVVEDLDGPRLSDRGRAIVASQVGHTLVRRLRLVEFWRRHPEVDEVVLPPVLHISGLPRTGTTLLHSLLDRHPSVRTLASWELKEPLPPPEATTYDSDPRIEEAAARLAPLRGTALEHHHWVEPTDPDENQWAATDLTGLLGAGGGGVLHAWARTLWDRERSLVPTFTELRRTIRTLLWHNPVPAGGVLVLKDPTTTSHLADFVAVFPEATVAVVHRDPLRVVRSAAATGAAVAAPLSDDPRPVFEDPVVWPSIQLAGLLEGLDVARESVHLAYPALVADPVGAAGRVLDAVGLDGEDEEFVAAADDFLAWQAGGGRARPARRYDDGGVTREQLLADPVVATYVERFAVAAEEQRLTGA